MKLGKEKCVCSHFYVESENADLVDVESKMVANRGLRVGREMSRCWSKSKVSVIYIIRFGYLTYNTVTIVNNIVLYT